MATRDDIAALTAFCECERELDTFASTRTAALKPLAEERAAAMQRLMDAMARAQVKCVSLPEDLLPGKRYARIVDVRSQRDLTPSLVTQALINGASDVVTRLEEQAREDDAKLEEVLEQALLGTVKEARTSVHSSISFTNNAPRGINPDTIPTTQSDGFKNQILRLEHVRTEYAQRAAEFKVQRVTLDEKKEAVLRTVRGYMDRMERDSQPVVLSGGASDGRAVLKRKVVTHKAPLTVDQFKQAVHTALDEARAAHGFPRFTVELWKTHRDAVAQRVTQLMDEMRVVDTSEVFKLERRRGRPAPSNE